MINLFKNKKIVVPITITVLLLLGLLSIRGGLFYKFFWQYFFQKEIELKKRDRSINVLLLGIGGETHEGPNLTDTIIFANINPEDKNVVLVSIPRDFWVSDLRAKINSAYAYGEEKKEGGGLILAKAVVSKVLGQQIDYAFRIDFNGFIKAVDLVGGLNVDVENVLDDYVYPISGKERDACGQTDEKIIDLTAQIATQSATESEAFPCRYKHIYFSSGLQKMDGEKALEFVRSRHGLGEEGTDFARSKRQEKVILAFKDNIFSVGTILNPKKIIDLYKVVRESIDTDIKEEEFDDFIKLAEKIRDAKIKTIILDYGDENKNRYGLLINPPISSEFKGQWVLAPRTGSSDYSEIQEYIDCEIKIGNCSITPEPAN